ncbi:MAG: NRDE family protein [Spirochaetota bacterium]
MCILFLAIGQHPKYPLILLANRDEFRTRPTAKAKFWQEHPQMLAGKDLQEGGTWLGIHKQGKLAALTNVRDIPAHQKGRKSRGHLVKDYLQGEVQAQNYLQTIQQNPMQYNPFNLLVGDLQELYVYSNMQGKVHRLEPGFHGLSNAFLNSPWPKLGKGIASLKQYIQGQELDKDELFDIMQQSEKAPDHLLPDTGVGLQKERYLSSIFIAGPDYGTSSTAIVLVDENRQVSFWERTFATEAKQTAEVHYNFAIEKNV